jgi:hypothetical protein
VSARLVLALTAFVVLGATVVLAVGLLDSLRTRWRRHLATHERAIRAHDCANGVHRTEIVPSIRIAERCIDCGATWELGVALLTATNRKSRRGAR